MKYFVFFMLFGGLFFSCNNSKMNETEDVLIQAKFSIDISKEKDFNEEFFLKNKEKLKDLNWEYNNGILTQTITFPNRDLELKNGSVIKTDKNSKAKFGKLSAQLRENLIIRESENSIELTLNGDEYIINSEHFFFSMDGGCCSDNNNFNLSEYSENGSSTPRCIDYNGSFGTNENDAETTLQEIINFIGSDCSKAMAMGYCWGEHSNGKGGCYKTHGGKLCSEFLK